MSRSCEEDPAFDYLLALLLESTAEPLTILPTHRVVRGLGADGVETLRAGWRTSSRCEPPIALRAAARVRGRSRRGRRRPVRVLDARRRLDPDRPPRGVRDGLPRRRPPPVASLDAWLLGQALERAAGLDAAAVEGGDRIGYTKSAAEALGLVDAATDGADAAFLLDPTPVEAIEAVARRGRVMPQKSTYFYPKALTGLVINPHEW